MCRGNDLLVFLAALLVDLGLKCLVRLPLGKCDQREVGPGAHVAFVLVSPPEIANIVPCIDLRLFHCLPHFLLLGFVLTALFFHLSSLFPNGCSFTKVCRVPLARSTLPCKR